MEARAACKVIELITWITMISDRPNHTPVVNVRVCSGTLSFEDKQAGCILYETNEKVYLITAAHALKMEQRAPCFDLNSELNCDQFHSSFPTSGIRVNFGESFEVRVVNVAASGLFLRLSDAFQSGSDYDWDWVMLATDHLLVDIPEFIEVQTSYAGATSGGLADYLMSNYINSYINLPDGTCGLERDQWVPGYSGCHVSRGILTMDNRTVHECVGMPDFMWGIATTQDYYIIHSKWSDKVLEKMKEMTWNTNNRLGLMILPVENALAKPWSKLQKLRNASNSQEREDVFAAILPRSVALQIVDGRQSNFRATECCIPTEKCGSGNSYVKMKTIMDIDDDIFFVGGASYKFVSENGGIVNSGVFAMANVSDDGKLIYVSKGKSKTKPGQVHGEVLAMCKVINHYFQNFASGSAISQIDICFHMDGRKGRPNVPCETCEVELKAFADSLYKEFRIKVNLEW